MRYIIIASQALAALCLSLVVACDRGSAPTESSRANFSAVGRSGFGFNGTVKGFPTGVVRLTGGGSYDPASASNTVPKETSVHSAGGFGCDSTVAQGPIAGCQAGQGVRWDTRQLLESTMFKCTASDPLKPKPLRPTALKFARDDSVGAEPLSHATTRLRQSAASA